MNAFDTALNEKVRALLRTQTEAGRQLGVQVCAYRHGRPIVDIWSGTMGPDDPRPVHADSLFSSFSTTKGVAATAVHVLADRGLLEYDEPVARYWPEFAANGKAQITVAQALSHQSGLQRAPDPMDLGFIQAWRSAIEWMANAAPAFPPGSATAYCALTFGWIAGGIVEGATGGRHIADVIREEIAEPLGISSEMFVGIPPGVEERLTTLTQPVRPAPAAPTSRGQAVARGEREMVAPRTPLDFNDPAVRAACIPAGNGHFSARALARMYAALANGGELDGCKLVSPERIPLLSRLCTDRVDLVLGVRMRKGIGYILGGSIDGTYRAIGPRGTAFGHPGAGGSVAFADPELGLSVAVTLNKLQPQSIQGEGVAMEICELVRSELVAGQ